jgi:hypothetical protein
MRHLLALFLCPLFIQIPAYCADGLFAPRNRLTLKTERVLADIDIYNDTVKSIIARLGPPNSSKTKSPEEEYTWEKDSCRVRVSVIQGRLESGITNVRRIYGPPTYLIWKNPSPYLLKFDPSCDTAPVLAIDFNDQGEVEHMQLTATDFYCF